jgi:hypothetical protein
MAIQIGGTTVITDSREVNNIAIRFDGNNNPTITPSTGVYSPAANEIAISTSGEERLRFKSDGSIVTANGTTLGGTNPNFEGAENITLYVNQSDKNASDIENNDGGNLNRPFKTIERALLEAAKRSYKANPAIINASTLEVGKAYTITSVGNTNFVSIGASSNTVGVSFIATAQATAGTTGTVTLNNDKFEAFTIMVLPGQYEIDNRPGYDITSNPLTSGTATTIDAEPFRFNPRNGGVIVPRGTSIVGYDLRKTVIRPKYVPAPFSVEGSISGDSFALSHVMYDGASMIEKNRGYIQEQTKLFLQTDSTHANTYNALSTAQKELCVRDIGYFIDAIVSDLRQGGNENTFNNAEYYIDGNGYRNQFMKSNDTDVTQEIAATVAAFNRAVSIMRFITKSYNDSTITYSEITSGKTINRTTFSAGNGYVSDGNCSTVVNAVATLGAIATGILNNPDDYTREEVTVTLVGGGTLNVKLRKTQGVFNQTSIFKVTGGCYFWQMTFKDAVATSQKPIFNGVSFNSSGIPTFTTTTDAKYSHHRVVAFTYADQRTSDGELDQYYKKIDAWQGRVSDPSQVRPEEFTIVGDGSKNSTIDTVNSCSPYIFNCSLRSIFGMCGMHTDGSKVAENSFKSMVVAQFTGISLQKDRNVFVQPKDLEGDTNVTPSPNSTTVYNDDVESTTQPPIFADPDAQYKPECRHFHIKASNGGFIQVVSVFAVGYADQFLAETGGDMSITNSNSNFGQISLRAKGSQFNAFKPASQGKITALIPPGGIDSKASDITFYNIDATTTWEKMGQSDNLFVASRLSQYSSNADQLRLYLEIGSLSSEDDIPELTVEVPDYSQSPVNGVYPITTKRYLTFGTTNQYALFRDFYTSSGTSTESNRYIKTLVEDTQNNKNPYNAKVSFIATSAENSIGNNRQRQGYFWDPISRSIYVKLDGTDSQTKLFLSDFIFKTKTEEVFTLEDVENADGSITTKLVSRVQNILEYKDGFPSGLSVIKNVDSRASSPTDLLWRVEYTIPKDCPEIPKPPEKRFIIKGIRPGNGEDGVPYADYRFMIWDVEEYLTWERNVRDGVYYLTLIRADVNKFVDGINNDVLTVIRRPTGISNNNFYSCKFIEELNNYDKDTKLVSNVNYLYPSINEEGPTYDVRRTWNPPQTDSRIMVENIGAGTRVKDISVPNYIRYRGSSTPFKDIPAMYSVTAEAIHRLVQAFDLRYAQASTPSTTRISVSPVVSWDDRSSLSSLGYTTADVNVYGNSNTYRIGSRKDTRTISSQVGDSLNINLYGIIGEAIDRRILVCNSNITSFTTTDLNNYNIAQPLSLYRPSILRASSHTWEYIGLGSGNYSTGFPQLQTRILKAYEQYIAQGYENSGGFVASSGTNSNGDFYIGTQIIQAGGSSTVSLNVPKVRKSSESNYVEIENIENRISNSVVNITSAGAGRSNAAQSAIKSLSNFFNAEKLSVSNIATINSLIIQEKLFISNPSINNAAFFPEANTNAYGFSKAAKPEKTGFISTDTNDKLYVSPKFLDAWRVKRQLISASAVTLDNNRIYIEPFTQAQVDSYDPISGIYEALSISDIQSKVTANQQIRLYLRESSGLPSYGSIDLDMTLQYVEGTDYRLLPNGSRSYLNSKLIITLSYDEIDYTENYVVLSKFQNNFPIVDYIKSCLGTDEYNQIVRNYNGFLTNGEKGINASEGDVKYLTAKLSANVSVDTIGSPIPSDSNTYKNISITTTADEWAKWPNRGAISLREYERGWTSNQYRVSTYVYFKSTTQGTFTLIKKVGDGTLNDSGYTYRANYDNKYPGIDDKNVFFAGSTCLVSSSDRWASESPFIPPLDPTKGAVEDVNIEEATLYEIPVKSVPTTQSIDEEYVNQNLPNPFSSKALGVNIQNRTAVKKFAPLSTFSQIQTWCDRSGFSPADEVELLMKPGYYKLDGSVFPCKIKINGSGLTKSSVFAGKEQTGISAGRMGGYLEDSVKRGDSIYLYRSPEFSDQYGFGNDAIYVNISGGLTSKGGFNLSNLHFLGLNEAVTKNEIPDTQYSSDENTITARRIVRKAYYCKSFIKRYYNTKTEDGFDGALSFNVNTTVAPGVQKGELNWIVNSDNIINGDINSANYGELNTATNSNSRYMVVRLRASNYASSESSRRQFSLARKYIIPGTTMYWISPGTTASTTSSSTKVISVRRVNPSTSETWTSSSTEELQIMVSIYRTTGSPNYRGNSGSYTNAIEDLDISGYVTGNDRKVVFLNEDGAEFTTLTYNWALNRRREFLPKGFIHDGGYQPAIIKRVTTLVQPGAGNAGVTISLDNIDLLKVGDKIVGAGIQDGTRIESINTLNKTITTSDNISSALAVKTPLSFTQFNSFGDELVKYDIPEIFGITRSSDNSYISLIIDRNPNASIDPSINQYPFGAGSYSNYPTALIQSKTNHESITTSIASPEDCAIAVPTARAYTKRVSGFQESRFVIFDVNPNSIADLSSINPANPQNSSINTYIENAGINVDIIKEYASYNTNVFSFGGGLGKGFSANTVVFNGENTTAAIKSKLESAILSGGRKYNSLATTTLTPSGGATGGGVRITPIINTAGGAGIITGFNVSLISAQQPITAFNGSYTITITDRKGHVLSPTGRTVDVNSTRLDGDDFTYVAKVNLFAAIRISGNGNVVPGSPYLEDFATDSFGDIDILSARGKKMYCSWPQSYRTLRRRFPSAPGSGINAINGNYQSSLINVDAIPGSNYDLNLTGVTIGAQSPASEQANTFGGGYRGGLIRCRGSKLTLSGTRFRGNLSLDWTGLLSERTSRAGGLFIAGHSIEMFQMEDQNSFERIGGELPARSIATSKEDEEFRKITEFDPLSNVYLEPSKDPYGNLSDGDARTFPLSTTQAIRRYNLNASALTAFDGTTIPPGALQGKVSLFERYQAPYPIYYDNTTTTNPVSIPDDANRNKYVELSGGTKASAIRLRWNNSSSTTVTSNTSVTSGSLASIPPKTLTFLYPADTDSGQDLVNNIFFGANATRIVKTTNIETAYAVVTRLRTFTDRFDKDGNPTTNGQYKVAFITYNGNIPSEIATANGSNIQVNTAYLNSRRYNYVSTTTSRYQKVVINKNSRLVLSIENNVVVYGEHSDLSFSQFSGATANISRSTLLFLRNITDTTSSVSSGRVRMQTDSSGRIISLDIVNYGSGHREGHKFKICSSDTNESANLTSAIEISARRNLDIDLNVFTDSEYMAVLPQNCFILNGITQQSPLSLKQKLITARSIFKPGSYILYNNLYYRIAKSDETNFRPYLGIYKYVNTNNLADQRSNIVVMLEDPEYAPTYESNARFDVFDYDNLLNYWPSSGRLVIGNRETCDFEKVGDPTTNTGYQLNITRSMTKYWPHYIRDWEGLDPNDSTDATVTLSGLDATIIRLADPVDVSCYGLKRILPSSNQTYNTQTVQEYISPTGIVSNKIAKVSIASDNVDNDFQKLSVGQTVTIPYKDISNIYNWSGCTITVGDAQFSAGASNSTNRSGDRVISGTIRSSSSFNTANSRTFNIFGASPTSTLPYQYVNPLTCGRFSNPRGDTFTITPSGFGSWNYMWTPVHLNAASGQSTITISPSYIASTYRLNSAVVFTASFSEIDNTTDPSERLMTVTAVSSGGLYKGQPIRTGNSVGSGTLVGYVVGFEGDVITGADGYEDSVSLTGTGNTGVYRIQLADGATTPTGSTTLNGSKNSDDHFVWGRNNCCWQSRINSKSVNPVTKVTTITLSSNLNVPSGGVSGDTSIFGGDWVLWYYYGYADNAVRLLLDKSLMSDIPEGTQLSVCPCNHQSEGYYAEAGIRETNGFVFKSRILDIEKDTNKLNIYLTDDYPENFTSSGMRTFGLMYINEGGWTYPKTGGSEFRANNAIITAPDANGVGTTIKLPNKSGRIKAGDLLTYTWEDEIAVESTNHAGGTISITTNTSNITTQNDQRSFIFPGALIYDSSSNLIGTVSAVSSTSISLSANYTGSTLTNATGWRYTSSNRTNTFSSQISSVSTTLDSNGYATCTLVSANQYQILHSNFGNQELWLSIDQIFVSHREGNFTNDGPVTKKFIYTDTGLKLTFGDYTIWYERYQNYIRAGTEPGGQEISGRQGWVGNFGLTNSGERARGLVMNGASSVQWGRQYQQSMWLTAVPVHAIWESQGYSNYMIHVNQNAGGIESNYAFNTLTTYDNAGRFGFNTLNHTSLITGSIYAGLNTGTYASGGGESYDTKRYQFTSSIRLKYNLQNSTISNTGAVAGGTSSRLSEQFLVDRIIHYKPSLTIPNSRITQSLAISITQNTATLTGTGIGNILLPGDVVYSANTPSSTNRIGVVRSVSTDNNSVTLTVNYTGTTISGNTSWSYISPRVKHAGGTNNNAPSLALVFSGGGSTGTTDINDVNNTGYNVSANSAPGYNRYNYRFNINRRTFNQTVLLNTYDQLLSTRTINDANRVININMGDLPVYRTPLMNVEVTRLNPKTHIEQSISVVGSEANI